MHLQAPREWSIDCQGFSARVRCIPVPLNQSIPCGIWRSPIFLRVNIFRITRKDSSLVRVRFLKKPHNCKFHLLQLKLKIFLFLSNHGDFLNSLWFCSFQLVIVFPMSLFGNRDQGVLEFDAGGVVLVEIQGQGPQ